MIKPEKGYFYCPACGYTHYENPAPCVSVLILSQGRILLGLRGNTSIKPNKWCLPCGHIEKEESFIEAAKREVREETGLEISLCAIVNVTSNHFSQGVHSAVIVLTAEPAAGVLRAGDDIADVGWFPLNGPFPDMAFQADVHIIEQYRRYGSAWGIPLSRTKTEFFENLSEAAPN